MTAPTLQPASVLTPLLQALLKCFGDCCWICSWDTGEELHRGKGLSWLPAAGSLHELSFIAVESCRRQLLSRLRSDSCIEAERVPLANQANELMDGVLHAQLVSDGARQLLVGRIERQPAQDRLEQLDRMAKLGELCMGIAHEIRTPMAAIFCTQSTLKEALDRLPSALDSVSAGVTRDNAVERLLGVLRSSSKVIGDGSERVRDIISQVRSYGCPGARHIGKVDINKIVKDTLALVRCELGHHTRVECDLAESVQVQGCAGSLNQVLVNLLVNAAHATRDRQRALIRVSTRLEGGRGIVLVSDDGVGICRKHLDRIFDAGFTTKPCDEGTGFGLFISRKIAAAHGGSLVAESEVGSGTCFRLELPAFSAGS